VATCYSRLRGSIVWTFFILKLKDLYKKGQVHIIFLFSTTK
jgi:hypothetical protein